MEEKSQLFTNLLKPKGLQIVLWSGLIKSHPKLLGAFGHSLLRPLQPLVVQLVLAGREHSWPTPCPPFRRLSPGREATGTRRRSTARRMTLQHLAILRGLGKLTRDGKESRMRMGLRLKSNRLLGTNVRLALTGRHAVFKPVSLPLKHFK